MILTGLATPVKTVVRAMRKGAFAFVEKPIDSDYLHEIIARAEGERTRRFDTRALRRVSARRAA